MKRVLAAVLSLCLTLASGLAFAGGMPEMKDQKDRESYSLGYQFGQSLKSQGLDINTEVYFSAVSDALGGKEPAMSPEDIRAAIQGIQQRVMEAKQRELKELAGKNLSEGRAFLEENKKKEGVITLPSGLQYTVLKEGTGKTPQATDQVVVNYKGSLINGTELGDSQDKTVPVGKVFRGWSEALQLMKEGARWRLFVPTDLAFGENGMGDIPPNSALIFETELVSVKQPDKN